MGKFDCTVWGFAKKGTKLLGHWGSKVNRHSEGGTATLCATNFRKYSQCHFEVLAEESLLKGIKLLRHYGTRVNLPLPTGEVDFVSERSEFTKSGEGTIFKMLNAAKKKCAFTLSEVLIVLAVLGVVAAITIPSLIQDYQERATVTAVQKIYSILNQAVDMGVANNGPIETWNWGTGGQSAVNAFRENIKPYLRIEKDCGIGTGCWYNGVPKTLDGSDFGYGNVNVGTYMAKSLLADGFSLALQSESGSCNTNYGNVAGLQNVCAIIYVDINGAKSPNTVGKDIFRFYVTPQGVVPAGIKGDMHTQLSGNCNLSNPNYCNGVACTGWVIKMGNMDYLRKTVSW